MITRYGNNHGISQAGTEKMISFEILNRFEALSIEEEIQTFEKSTVYGDRMRMQDYTVATNGVRNNLPNEMKTLLSSNHLIPGLMKKQVRFMYGAGPFLYQEKMEDNHMKHIWAERAKHPTFWKWLSSWKANGMADDVQTYIKKVATNYYYTEDFFSKRLHNKSRRVGGNGFHIRGLEHVSTHRARLMTEKIIPGSEELRDEDLTWVGIGPWDSPWNKNIELFSRFNEADPLKENVSINYIKDITFGDEIYSTPTYFFGLRDWIIGSNLNPKYVNSFLKHSFNARIHCVIPSAWFATKEKKFREYCEENREREQRGLELIKEYEGVKLVSDTGAPFEFDTSMVQKCVDLKIEQLTTVMSGEGKNQGKIFYSRSFRTENGIESWEFKEIPTNYKEFMTSINDYDKRSVRVVTEGMGLDPALSNIGSEGIFSNSGSQVYYNYLVDLNSLQYAEEFILADLNSALKINFPRIYNEGFRLGLYRNVPQRLEETNPTERPSENHQ
jgi:hypothetical protein